MSITVNTQYSVSKFYRIPLYGLLYNWYAAVDERGIAPSGWHIPTKTEFETLVSYLGGSSTAGGALKEVGTEHWQLGNTGATNTSGFTLLGNGWRDNNNGTFFRYYWGYVWSSTSIYGPYKLGVGYSDAYSFISNSEDGNKLGSSIRYIMDNPNDWYDGMTIKDYDGNTYNTVKIGNQVWIKENVAVTHYNNGDSIPEVTDNAAWASLSTGALCAYNNDWSDVFKS